MNNERYLLAFDTANEVIALGIGRLHPETRSIELVAEERVAARRASNTQLLPCIDALVNKLDIDRSNIACVACGTGPGSFTGVRIAMATAKGIASALEVGLLGVSTLEAVAWGMQHAGLRGQALVVADAMRKEVYPVRFVLREDEVERLEADHVVKAEDAAEAYAFDGAEDGLAVASGIPLVAGDVAEAPALAGDGVSNSAGFQAGACAETLASASNIPLVAGDALTKYAELFACCGHFASEELWTPTGRGLLLAAEAMWRRGEVDLLDAVSLNPAFALPVYTRLSDAEENERIRLSKNDPKNLRTGVQDAALRRDQRATAHDTAIENACANEQGIVFRPLDAAHVAAVSAWETVTMGTDAWSEALVADELTRKDRVWWAAFCSAEAYRAAMAENVGAIDVTADVTAEIDPAVSNPVASELMGEVLSRSAAEIDPVASDPTASEPPFEANGQMLVGYAGGWVIDGQVQILKVAVAPAMRRCGIARTLLAYVASDARDLGASTCSLEVRVSNEGAQRFYEALGLHGIGVRPRYYSDREDALIMEGPLPLFYSDVAGMQLQINTASSQVTSRIVSASTEVVAPLEAYVSTEVSAPLEACTSTGTSALLEACTSTEVVVSPVVAVSENPACNMAECQLILAIESSCDETAAAIVDANGTLVSDVVASQIDFHARFGGVVPEIASRKHIEAMCGVTGECLDRAAEQLAVPRLRWRDLSAVAVTYAPGLVGALVVGVAFAKGAAWAVDVPFIGVNHLEGHIYANKIATPDVTPPMVVSLVSGGHTMLVHVRDWGNYETLGATLDDAVGEAFDKVAKTMGLGYPGGPIISKLAAVGNPAAIDFPRAMMHSGDLRFSLSGLKTAVITYLRNEEATGRVVCKEDVAASFQQAVIDVQVAKAERALAMTGAKEFCLGGGVAANPALRAAYERMCEKLGVRLTLPPLSACTDNAGMIALVAFDRYKQGRFFGLDADAQAHVSMDEPY